MASAPPEPPSPMTVAMIGVRRRAISKRLRPMASDWPRSSASMPGIGARRVDEGEHRQARTSPRASSGAAPCGSPRAAACRSCAQIFSLVSRPFWWPITMHGWPLKRARPPTIAGSSAKVRSPCSSSKSREERLHVVERVGTLRMARDLRDLPRRELAVDVLGERLAALGEALDLVGDVDRRVVLHEAQLLDAGLELRDGLLELEEGGLHVGD